MAELAEYHVEESIPELEDMLRSVFKEDEVKILTKIRRGYEYSIAKSIKSLNDCLRYINFETKLLKTIQFLIKKRGLQPKTMLTNVQNSIKNRITRLYISTIRWFPADMRVWLLYLKFCSRHEMEAAGRQVLAHFLDKHGPSNPDLFKLAANWEQKQCRNEEKARAYLLMGIHMHSENKGLLISLFDLELTSADRLRKLHLEHKHFIDKADPQVTLERAETVYEKIKKEEDVELLNQVWEICSKFDFAQSLQYKVAGDIWEFDREERMWEMLVQRELNSTENTLKNKIGKSVELYETAVKRVNTPLMWSYYLDTLLSQLKDNTTLPNFKRKLLLTALQKAANANKLTEKYYLIWVDHLQGTNKYKKSVEMLQSAVKKLPKSVDLWELLLRYYLLQGDDKNATTTFEVAVEKLEKDSLPLWKLMLQHEQIKRNSKVEELYRKSWTQPKEVSDVLKPRYLEWTLLIKGIAPARKLYREMANMPPFCLELHKKMIDLEGVQVTLNIKKTRLAHTLAVVQFGDKNTDVWLDFCQFEIKHGDPEKVPQIQEKARQELPPQLYEQFLRNIIIMKP